VSEDIAAAIDAFRRVCPTIARVVIWGLCDAASAALIYADANPDASIAGIVLVNPWVRSDTTMARTQIRHYYAKRLFDRAFWSRFLRGRVAMRDALADVTRAARIAHGASKPDRDAGVSFQDRMASGLSTFAGPVLLILSGRDLTAREFEEYSSTDPRWKGLLARHSIERRDFDDADHTFSAKQWRDEVETATVEWIERHVMQASR
jgi:exosortase A-associated hydrolase 1